MSDVEGNRRIDLPKASQVIASTIRRQIVTGELKEGGNLPPEHELTRQFGVSRPSLREAYRILESESLIVIKRGARGGARVQAPSVKVAARYIGYLLQVKGATLKDVHQARLAIEPLAASAVARSWNDATAAELQQALADEEAVISDPPAYTQAALRFHRLVVELVGNPVFEIVLETVSGVIDFQATHTTRSLQATRSEKDIQAGHLSHLRLVELMSQGAAERAQQHWRAHLEASADYIVPGSDSPVIDLFK